MSRDAISPLPPDLVAGLVNDLIDDAAMFPPGNAPVAEALAGHTKFHGTRYESAVGPLLTRASSIEELRDAVDPDSFTRLGIVADGGIASAAKARDAIQDDAWFELTQVEIALPLSVDAKLETEQLLQELSFTVPTYIEIPKGADPNPIVQAIATDGAERAKFRCGPDDVPTSQSLSDFIGTCAQYRVPFKLTAGLHHALPHVDELTGVRQHGFLNALAATWLAIAQAPAREIVNVLDTTALNEVAAVLADADVAEVRRLFRSFGCCGVQEPIDDLIRLGLITPAQMAETD